MIDVIVLVMPATIAAGYPRLPTEAEGGGELNRTDVARRRDAEDVAARTPAPGDPRVPCRKRPGGQGLHDRPGGSLDAQYHACCPGEPEVRSHALSARACRQEAER